MQNKVVVHFLDGRLIKGFTSDFFPNKPAFHVEPAGAGESTEVQVDTLKGVYSATRPAFFVFPSDPRDNNEKVFVVTAATKNVGFV